MLVVLVLRVTVLGHCWPAAYFTSLRCCARLPRRDFGADPKAWEVDDQFMFGDSYLAAPVLTAGARKRHVYLPSATTTTTTTTTATRTTTTTMWRHVFTNQTFVGGKNYSVDAPLDSFPLFWRVGSDGEGV